MVGQNYSQGAAYVFVQNGDGTWAQQAELTASDGATGDIFGNSVAVSGNSVAVGAPFHSVGSHYQQGAAYLFADNGGTWRQQAELSASGGEARDYFGASVAVSGSSAVVGASCHPYSQVVCGPGAAYVFVQNVDGTWSERAGLTASDGEAGDAFGQSVAVDGSTALVGAPWHEIGSNQRQGAAYVWLSATTVMLSPTSLSFGNEPVNVTSVAKTVTLKNLGNSSLYVNSLTASTNFAVASTTCSAPLGVGKTCKASVTFTPSQPYSMSGTLSFNISALGNPLAVALWGQGAQPAALTPPSATYAKQAVGTTSAAKTFILINNQTVPLTGIAISASGDFAVSATTCGTSLAAKARCTIGVRFTPTATGTRTGQLSVSDSASNSPQTSNLTGTGK